MFNTQLYLSSVDSDEEYNKFLNEVMNVDYSIFYRGTVVDNNDPLNLGRVRVRVPQIYGSEQQRDSDIYTPTYAIPWATSAIMSGAGNNTGSFLIPNIGDTVFITFENGDSRLPMYFGGILTIDGKDKFIGSSDVNGDNLYKVSGSDVNTDIKDKSQRIIYKSLKGATILISDKDGEESIRIIDQLGQQIVMENYSGESLKRDRTGSVNSSAACGRILVRDAYGDSIEFHEGEIHIKTPKLVIEADDIKKVGFEDQFPDEVNYANEILGEDD